MQKAGKHFYFPAFFILNFYFSKYYKTPFVEGSWLLFKSRFTAILMALAKALKMASIL